MSSSFWFNLHKAKLILCIPSRPPHFIDKKPVRHQSNNQYRHNPLKKTNTSLQILNLLHLPGYIPFEYLLLDLHLVYDHSQIAEFILVIVDLGIKCYDRSGENQVNVRDIFGQIQYLLLNSCDIIHMFITLYEAWLGWEQITILSSPACGAILMKSKVAV